MKQFKKWLENKTFVALLICVGVFIVFAPLTYVWGQASFIAMFALGASVIVFALLLRQRKEQLKERYLEKLNAGELTPSQQKRVSFDIKQQQFQIVLLYILGGAVILFTLNQLARLF